MLFTVGGTNIVLERYMRKFVIRYGRWGNLNLDGRIRPTSGSVSVELKVNVCQMRFSFVTVCECRFKSSKGWLHRLNWYQLQCHASAW
jgi:hypothetical protein